MVAHLLRLRFLVLRNSLLRSTWQLVAAVIGALYGIGVLAAIVVGLVALRWTSPEIAQTVIVLAGSAALLGWIVIPLLTSGIEQTLDPVRLARFPIPPTQLLVGLTLAGVLGVPGIVTLVASLATVATWSRSPLAIIAALVSAIVAVLTCVIASRMIAAVSSTLGSSRRYREFTGMLIFIPVIFLGPLLATLAGGFRGSGDALPDFAHAVSWTPLGAIWSVPGEIVLGHPELAALKLAIGLAALAVVTILWKRSLVISVETPARSLTRTRQRGKLGFLALFPATPTGAVAARSLTYWLRDPRYARQLLIVPLFPILLFFNSSLLSVPELVTASGPIVALLLSLSIYSDVSYDNTAFATHLAAGVSGMADRAGRVIALGVFAFPLVLLITIASVWFSDSWQVLPGLLGLGVGLLLSGMGLSSVTSARMVFPVPAPDDNVFTAKPAAGVSATLTTLAAWGILLVLVLPELILTVVGLVTGWALLGWSSLAVGVILGGSVLAGGIRLGGSVLERRGPDLLAQLARQR